MIETLKPPSGMWAIIVLDPATKASYVWCLYETPGKALDAAKQFNDARTHESDDVYNVVDDQGRAVLPENAR